MEKMSNIITIIYSGKALYNSRKYRRLIIFSGISSTTCGPVRIAALGKNELERNKGGVRMRMRALIYGDAADGFIHLKFPLTFLFRGA